MPDTLELSPPLELPLDQLKREFVQACRILDHENITRQAFNVSVRVDGDKMMAIPATSPTLVTIDNLETFPIKEGGSPEWKAHAAIYGECPETGAIVHTHAPHVVAFSATDEEFVPVHHYGAPFHGKMTRYASPGQVRSVDRALDIAQQIKGQRAIIQNGHGVIVLGKDLREALILSIFLEEACWTLLTARQFGEVKNYLTLEESERITPQILNQASQDKTWFHFVDRLPDRGNF